MTNLKKLDCVYIVSCYQSLIGVYASQEDAAQVQREYVAKNRPADVLCRSIIYPLNEN